MTTGTQTEKAIHPYIAQRRSPRAYQSTRVDQDTIVRLLEAARWAASSRNRQPWHFIVATRDDPQEYRRLLHCLNENNQKWAQSAPVLMLVVALMEEDGNPLRHSWYDTGLAVGNLTVQAMNDGLMLRQMGGIDRDKARLVYNIPEAYEAVCGLAIGYPADPDTLPADQRERETARRTRKSLRDFVFSGKWGRTASIVTEKAHK